MIVVVLVEQGVIAREIEVGPGQLRCQKYATRRSGQGCCLYDYDAKYID